MHDAAACRCSFAVVGGRLRGKAGKTGTKSLFSLPFLVLIACLLAYLSFLFPLPFKFVSVAVFCRCRYRSKRARCRVLKALAA